MILLTSARRAVTLLVACGGAFVMAAGCGASDDKKAAPAQAGEAGGGGDDGVGPSAGGGASEVGGALNEGGARFQGGAAGEGGVPSKAGAGHGDGGEEAGGASSLGGGDGRGGAGGAPVANSCEPLGDVLALSFDSEPIYQGCRGAVVRVPFSAESGDSALTCCGTSTAAPAFDVELSGGYVDGGGSLQFQVPSDAPFGVYGLEVSCGTSQEASAFSLEINEADAPFVLSVSAQIVPAGAMLINGQHLSDVSTVGAYRASDGAYYECVFDPETDQTDTRIDCSFDGDIPISVDQNDTFAIYVASEECGSAPNPPSFLVVDPGS